MNLKFLKKSRKRIIRRTRRQTLHKFLIRQRQHLASFNIRNVYFDMLYSDLFSQVNLYSKNLDLSVWQILKASVSDRALGEDMSCKKSKQEPQKPVSGFPQNRFERYEERVRSSMDTILTTDEVSKMRKAYLEKFIVRHSELIGKDLTLYCRRTYTPEGAFDLWFENRDNDITIVELKLKRIGKGDLDNLRRCIHYLRETATRNNVYGIVVCKDVSPIIVDELKKQQDIQVFCFGWKLLVYPKHWD